MLNQTFNVPKLRFGEFEGEWVEKRLKDVVKVSQGLQIAISNRFTSYAENRVFYITIPFIQGKKIEYIENPRKSILCKNEDMLVVRTGSGVGKIIRGVNGAFHNNFFKIKDFPSLYNSFLFYFLIKSKTQFLMGIYAGTSAIPDLNHSDFYSININFSSLEEQKKIATFLTSIDKKIEQLNQKRTLLESYKKGVMQKIFSQEIRFKRDDGGVFEDWKEKRFKEVFNRVTTKNKENNLNVLTISAQQGLINQEKYFNKSVSSKNVTGYYLLHKDDFAYNKSYSKGYPMGAIKRLKRYDKGVVSTLYICFRAIKDNVSFLEQVFNNGNLNRELHKIAQEGARNHGLLNMSVVEFFNDISLTIPCIKEQQKISNFLTSIDQKITQNNQALEEMKAFKKGLLQQMFV